MSPIGLFTGQSDRGSSSAKVPSSKVILVCVKLTKMNQPTKISMVTECLLLDDYKIGEKKRQWGLMSYSPFPKAHQWGWLTVTLAFLRVSSLEWRPRQKLPWKLLTITHPEQRRDKNSSSPEVSSIYQVILSYLFYNNDVEVTKDKTRSIF